MKQSIQPLIIFALASTWYGCTISTPDAFTTRTDYHQRILTVSTDGFKRLLSLEKDHLTLETIKKLEHALNDTQCLLMSDENNIVIVMVWNELVKNMLIYLMNITTLKKHHLDRVNLLLREFQQWLTTYAEAHHSEGLIVQEVYHFIEMYKSMAANATAIPYGGIGDRFEYVSYKCIERSPLIIGGMVVLGLVFSLRPKSQQEKSFNLHTSHVYVERSNNDISELCQKLYAQNRHFQPLGDHQTAIKEEFTKELEKMKTKEGQLAKLLPCERKAFYQQLLQAELDMELHMHSNEKLIDLFSYLGNRKKQQAIINVLIKRYEHAKNTKKKEALQKILTELEPVNTILLLKNALNEKAD